VHLDVLEGERLGLAQRFLLVSDYADLAIIAPRRRRDVRRRQVLELEGDLPLDVASELR
jgi:hypothetical protein